MVACLVILSGAGCATDLAQTPHASSTVSYEQVTNSLAICLLDPVTYTDNWSNVRLKSPPVIADSDIVAFDLTNRMIKLKPGVFKRLPGPETGGIVFVCVVDGVRLFPGVFWSDYSSYDPPANAMIVLEPSPGKDYLILECWANDEPNAGVLRTELPWELQPPSVCPWSDSRLRSCLEKLNKLKQVEYP